MLCYKYKESQGKLSIIRYAIFDSSLGNMLFVSKNNALIRLKISQDDPSTIKNRFLVTTPEGIESMKLFVGLARQIDLYMKGERIDFRDVALDLSCLSPFTQQVLSEVRKIPYGETRSYGWISRRLGFRNAGRAVGQALKANPIPIIIPCHRVIREDGSIGGFTLGTNIKRRLLSIEGIAL